MAGKNTRAYYFENAKKVYMYGDLLGAFALASVGLVAPLVDPFSDLIERWKNS